MVYREEVDRVDVFRTWLWPLPNRKAHERMRNYASFCLSAALRGLTLPRPDVIIASSPQLLVGLSGWWLALRAPGSLRLRSARSLAGIVGRCRSWRREIPCCTTRWRASPISYTGDADHIVVVTPAFKEHLIQRWRVPAEKIAIVENGVETDLFAPASPAANAALRRELGAEGKFLVCYIGTMGMAHGLETLLDAAAQLQRQNSRRALSCWWAKAPKKSESKLSRSPAD